jgi:hypothetical protein
LDGIKIIKIRIGENSREFAALLGLSIYRNCSDVFFPFPLMRSQTRDENSREFAALLGLSSVQWAARLEGLGSKYCFTGAKYLSRLSLSVFRPGALVSIDPGWNTVAPPLHSGSSGALGCLSPELTRRAATMPAVAAVHERQVADALWRDCGVCSSEGHGQTSEVVD